MYVMSVLLGFPIILHGLVYIIPIQFSVNIMSMGGFSISFECRLINPRRVWSMRRKCNYSSRSVCVCVSVAPGEQEALAFKTKAPACFKLHFL